MSDGSYHSCSHECRARHRLGSRCHLLGDRQFSQLRMCERGNVESITFKHKRKERNVLQNMLACNVTGLPIYVII